MSFFCSKIPDPTYFIGFFKNYRYNAYILALLGLNTKKDKGSYPYIKI